MSKHGPGPCYRCGKAGRTTNGYCRECNRKRHRERYYSNRSSLMTSAVSSISAMRNARREREAKAREKAERELHAALRMSLFPATERIAR